jgi:two-component system chemotaxis response regulator CheB
VNREPYSVLVVDDSALMRNLVGKIISTTEDFSLAGTAMNGLFALQKLSQYKLDAIILDLEMPQMNGIQFLKEKKLKGNDVPVIILSSVARKGAEITMEALALGASDFITKPSGSVSMDINKVRDQLIEKIRAYGRQYRISRDLLPPPEPGSVHQDFRESAPGKSFAEIRQEIKHHETAVPVKPAPSPRQLRPAGSIDIIAIGISTGGPNALREVFSQLSPDIRQPILVVQHMPAGFTEAFAGSLDRICPLAVSEAKEGDIIKPGRVLIAPGDYHMEVEKKPLASVIRLSKSETVNGHRPSVDVLFSSIAKHYSNKALAVIMTGMGRDGAKEIGTIFIEGGRTIAQDETSSIVFGMPHAAIESGVIQQIVPLNNMAAAINSLALEHQPTA